jgi:hypothetical protein
MSKLILPNRRRFMSHIASTGVAAGLAGLSAEPVLGRAAAGENPISEENTRPGTLEWQLLRCQYENPDTMVAYRLNRKLRSSNVEGYCSKTSLYPGDSIDFHISGRKGDILIDIYRLGYYGGQGGRHMTQLGPFTVEPQPMPMMTMERLRECRWERTVRFDVPRDWTSGVYVAKMTRQESFGAQQYLVFIVKSRQPADVLFMCADLTWQAYNKWPGKNSLYDDGTPELWYTGPNVRVGFNRPYAKYCQVIDAPHTGGSGSFLLWEFPLAFWLEAQGYNVSYCSNLDLHLDETILQRHKLLLSVGHDEYWSREMYDNVMKARDDGLNIAFLSGNAVYHEIVMYNSEIDNRPSRAYARRRMFPDEQDLMGVRSYGTGYGDWTVKQPDHWLFEKTGMQLDEEIPGLIGWEYHGDPAEIAGLEVLAHSVTTKRPDPKTGCSGTHSAIMYPGPRNNMILNVGTIWWPEGLSRPPGHIPARTTRGGPLGVDPRVQQITANFLDRCIG